MTKRGSVIDDRMIRAGGDRALLIVLPESMAVTELAAALRIRAIDGVQDVLPAAKTVLVTLNSIHDSEFVRGELLALLTALYPVDRERDSDDVSCETPPSVESSAEPVQIPVRYDGADLDDVAKLLDLTTAEVIAAHTETVWRCAFVGFAPGFGYLASPDGRLSVPRRVAARVSVPAGSVALAGGYSAVYPRSSPGGWQLIGRTEERMWDVDRDPPALIRAGAPVRFVDIGGR